ncbi:serine/threonine protein kinase [Saccharothrix saharensis]|uniref:non-specific serine/threonine protein kinase n=1 Tax=Saccharothrix saharensis TaxID=571190 RepID=A0A543JIG0_9PSEU|nr:serine/threonine-protein kinase [Saccharothrix saharensis]TQM82595.1 serine/threonine protein kinase [Saccharothrix saharensis]
MAESGGTGAGAGTVGGRYALVERVGSGAMGVVWRARDELLDREVAVKQLRWPDLAADAAEVARARAMREARNAARLQHPDAISVFDVVVEDDRPWLVMEYLPAHSLAGLLAERGGLDPDEVARIGGRVASALAAAHAAGIVHRDVKPSNVLIGHDGRVKLTDFGISRAAGDGTLTDSGMITGTPAFLAPEVARGEQPSPASDVFSLGATLYAAIEGQSPHGVSDNSFGLLYRAAAGRIEPPRRSGALTGVLMRLLASDPAERPTAAEAGVLLTGPERTGLQPRGAKRAGAETVAVRKPGVDRAESGRAGAGRAESERVTPEPVEPEPAEAEPVEPEPAGPEPAESESGREPGRAEAGPGDGELPGAGAGEPGAGRQRRKWPAPVVATIVLLLGAGAVAVAALQPWSSGEAGPTTSPSLGLAAGDAAELVRRHYEALPEDPAAAYANLAASFQRPFEEYQAFWSQYDDVGVDGIEVVEVASARYAVRVRVNFSHEGTASHGRYELGVWPDGGRLQIFSSQQLE